MISHLKGFASLAALAALLSACSTVDRLESLGQPPKLAPVADPRPQSYMPQDLPMPPPVAPMQQANSLWRPSARSFFRDPRASHIGDILTVNVSIADAAQISDTTARSRKNSDDAGLTNFFGLETNLVKALPGAPDPGSLVKMGSDTSNTGSGSVDRKETINLTLAALVAQVLQNGNLVITGHQQVRVNNELRDLQISGVVRPEDITNANTVDLAQIAEARISYGGRGTISDVQTPRWGSEVFDSIMPF
jgi:flagellar L-ring protein precursor FlgH